MWRKLDYLKARKQGMTIVTLTGNTVFLCALVLITPFVHGQSVTEISAAGDRLRKDLEIHGFVSQGWMRSTDNNWLTHSDHGSFDYSEFGLSFSGYVTDDVRVGVQLFSGALGDNLADGVSIDWAYADYYVNEHLGWQVGRTKTPIGLYGDTRDFDSIRTFILLPQGVYSDVNRDQAVATNGTMLYGHLDFNEAGAVAYNAWIGTNAVDPDGGMVKSIESALLGWVDVTDVDTEYNMGLRLLWETPLSGLSLTGTALRVKDVEMYGVTATGFDVAPPVMGFVMAPRGTPVYISAPRSDVITFGLEYSYYDLIFASEYMTYRSKTYTSIDGGQAYPRSTETENYYFSLTYQASEKISLGTCYSLRYGNASDKDGSRFIYEEPSGEIIREEWKAWQKDVALALRYDLTDSWSIKAEYHWINGTNMLLASENPDGVTKNWDLFLIKVSYIF